MREVQEGVKYWHLLVQNGSTIKHARRVRQIQISSLRLADEANSSSVELSFKLIRSSDSRVSTCKRSLKLPPVLLAGGHSFLAVLFLIITIGRQMYN